MKQSETVLSKNSNVSVKFENVSRIVSCILIFVVFILTLVLTSSATLAHIQYYEINTELTEDGTSIVSMIITFAKPEKKFSFTIIGRVENFTASSIAGPVDCKVEVTGISSINCNVNLTKEKRQVEIRFVTPDFVRNLEDKIFFSGDFSLGRDVDSISASLKLPLNAFLVGENVTTSMLSFPDKASVFVAEDGRILINWRLTNISKDQPLKLEALYQQISEPLWFKLRIRHFILLGIAFASALGFIIFRYFRKSEKLVLSVLDEYERRIVDILLKEGKMKQKKIVEMTNFSKAKVSRVVKSLAERGLIEVERRGRTNLLELKKKKISGEF